MKIEKNILHQVVASFIIGLPIIALFIYLSGDLVWLYVDAGLFVISASWYLIYGLDYFGIDLFRHSNESAR